MGFQNVKEWLNQQKTLAQESITRFKNKDFLEAVVAGCALVAAADGKISDQEKATMAGFIQRDEALKVFDMSEVIASFNKFIAHFEFNAMVGKAEAFKAVHKIKANAEAARLLIRVCCAIGMADGDFGESEKAAVREMCVELGLNPADFGLGTQAKSSSAQPPQDTVSQELVNRFKNKDFLEAVVAGCALVAASDGKIDKREKERLEHWLQVNDAIKVFDSTEVVAKFNKFATNFDFSLTIGHAEARKVVQKLKSDSEAARTLIRLCCEMGQVDDHFGENEKAVIRGLCVDLGLNSKEFGL